MTIKVQYKLAYSLIKQCGDFETYHTLCFSYGIARDIRMKAFESYYWSKYDD